MIGMGRMYLPSSEPSSESPSEPVEAEESVVAPAEGGVEEPAGNASRDEWVQFARSQGATDSDLVDDDGKDLGRDAIREKYGIPSA